MGGEWLVVGNKAKENVSPGGDKAASQDPALLSGRDEREVQKLNGKAYKFGEHVRDHRAMQVAILPFARGAQGKRYVGSQSAALIMASFVIGVTIGFTLAARKSLSQLTKHS